MKLRAGSEELDVAGVEVMLGDDVAADRLRRVADDGVDRPAGAGRDLPARVASP
jgi:hypothetical protein